MYLAREDLLGQSGFSGDEARWKACRGIQLAAVHRDGTFLDVGCANGYLLECLVGWAAEQGRVLEPYGVDIGGSLVELARRRLPAWRDRFLEGDIWTWSPPRRFDFVSTGLGSAAPHRDVMLEWLMTDVVKAGGRLILRSYFRPGHHGEFDGSYVDHAAYLRSRGLTPAGWVASDPPGAEFVWIDC